MSNFLRRSFVLAPRCKRIFPLQNQSISTGQRLCQITPTPKKRTKLLRGSPITWKSIALTTIVGSGIAYYISILEEEKDRERDRQRKLEIGKAQIGGKFELVNSEGKLVKSDDFLGKWILLYFGFTHCPDVCPDELEKLTQIVDKLEKEHDLKVQPLFITVDPQRDTPELVGKYVKEFSDKIIGLSGTIDQIAQVCKAYRVYFSNGAPAPDTDDYIVDHTIIIYLIDPDGNFIDYYGQTFNAEQITNSVMYSKLKYDVQNDRSFGASLKKLIKTE